MYELKPAVLAISDQELKGDTADCHFVIVPVFPDKLKEALVEPKQMAEPPLTVPPTDAGVTVIVAEELFAAEQTPWVTTAR